MDLNRLPGRNYAWLQGTLAPAKPLESINPNDAPQGTSESTGSMAAPNGPKVEANVDGGSFLNTANVKPEPGSIGPSPAAQSEDDIYEDTGDLDFSEAGRDVWLCRVPRFLFENWKGMQDDDDEQVRIGTVRVEKGVGDTYKRVSLRLDGALPQSQSVPKDYVLDVMPTKPEGNNMFVFSEKDMPGYKSKLPSDFSARSYLYEKTKAENKSREERKKKWEPYSRRGIPKQTALAGAVKVEANCNPVENEEYQRMMEEQAREKYKKKNRVEEAGDSAANMGGLFRRNAQAELGTNFIRGAEPVRKKVQDNKATRIPENELLDIIISKFSQYRYWSFKNLKSEVRQPEAFLKQTLEKVARNVKNGDFAGTWTLRNQEDGNADPSLQKAEAAFRVAKDEAAPDGPGSLFGFDGGDDDDEFGSGMDEDDNNVEMEDVKL